MDENVKSFLDKIQEVGEKTIKAHVPSQGKKLDFKNLTFKQQKDIITTITDGAIGALKFQGILNDVILENCDNRELVVTDKAPVMLALRQNSISDNVRVDKDKSVKISDLLKKVTAYKPQSVGKVDAEVVVDLKVPTLVEENKVIKYLIDNIDKDSGVGKTIGQIYTFEIVKYIDKVTIGELELDFSKIPVKDRCKIVDNLPLAVNKKIITFINKIKESEKDLLTNEDGDSIEIDFSFFDSEE